MLYQYLLGKVSTKNKKVLNLYDGGYQYLLGKVSTEIGRLDTYRHCVSISIR